MAQRNREQPAKGVPPSNGPGSPGADNGTAATDRADLETQLNEEKERGQGYLSQWQRAAADYQNLKRRTEQEREEYARLANTALILNILPAVDDFDRALANVDPELTDNVWVEGVRAIQRKLKGALEAAGVSEIRAEGEHFDPNIHEAISGAPGAHGAVVAEVQRGYKLGSRVIRPALVVVGDGQDNAAQSTP